MIGNIAQNGIRKRYRNQPTPGRHHADDGEEPDDAEDERAEQDAHRPRRQLGRLRTCRGSRAGARSDDGVVGRGLASPDSSSATIAVTPLLDAAVEIVALELRRHLVADDAARHRVGQRAFEAVAHLDAHLAVLRRDDDQHAVVLALLPDLPLGEHAVGDTPRCCPGRWSATVSTTTWLVVRSSCALSAAVSRSRAAGDRISALSTTRPDR